MIEKIRNEQTDALCKAFASLKTVEECYKFLDDLCTLKRNYRDGQAPVGRADAA